MLEKYYKKLAKYRFFPYFVCMLAASFYLYEFAIRVSPSIMTSELMSSFHVQSFALGGMAAAFFYVYVPMQIPAGLLVDRFGPRLLLSVMMLVCAMGCLLFATTTSIVMAGIGRALMGFGSAFVFISILVLISRWCPSKQFAMLAGITQLLGAVGAIAAEKPLIWAVNTYGWRTAVLFFLWLGLFLAGLMWLFIRDYAPGKKPLVHNKLHQRKNISMEKKRLRIVLGKKQTWYVGIYSFTSWTAVAIFATLWGVQYIQTVFHVSASTASGVVSMAWIGVAIGSPLIGWWSDHIGQRRLPLLVCSLIGLLGTGILFYSTKIPFYLAYPCAFMLGFAAGAQPVTFGIVKDINMPSNMGTASGFNNMAVIIGAAIFQPLVGHLLEWHWNGVMSHGAPVYTAFAYHHAMEVIPVIYILGVVLAVFFINETNCEPVYKYHDEDRMPIKL